MRGDRGRMAVESLTFSVAPGEILGIAGVADRLSDALGAHLIAQRYSRLVVDCNRPPTAESAIPLVSEATTRRSRSS